jgi:hypothetical protein
VLWAGMLWAFSPKKTLWDSPGILPSGVPFIAFL